MTMAHRPQRKTSGRREQDQGLALALLISIPIWVCIGIVVLLLYQKRPITEAESAVLMLAAVVEVILLRDAWRRSRQRMRFREFLVRADTGAQGMHPHQLKQTALLSGLVGAYLHYYFWDVSLQIASLSAVTVFVLQPTLG